MSPRSCILLFALLVLALGTPSCGGARRAGPVYVHPSYRPMVDAIVRSFDEDELDQAGRTLALLRSRLATDRAIAEGATPEAPLPPERPTLDVVAAGERAAEGLERILESRILLAGLDSRLVLRRVQGEQAFDVLVECRSDLSEDIVLRPGPASLEVRRVSLEPRLGQERRSNDLLPVRERLRLEVPAGGEASAVIARVPIQVPTGTIAARTTCTLLLRAGTLEVDGRELPAQEVPVASAERTDLPAKIPASPVEPEELARHAADLTAGPASLAERAVRILPERRAEALELLVEPVAARTDDELRLLVPALRWLSATDDFGRDPLEWRAYMEAAPWRGTPQ